jgi:DNA-binding NarL/FixJ family response regulator
MDAIAPLGHLHVAATATTPYGGPVAFVLGRLSAFLGDREAAAAWFGEAERRAGLMGATWHAETARRALAGLRRSQTPLSPRESEVALLIADGASNRQIAERLFLSERTVEQHVRSILRKLDAPNRSAVASWVSRREA